MGSFILMKSKETFEAAVQKIKSQGNFQAPLAFGLGIRRTREGQTLDVTFPFISFRADESTAAILVDILSIECGKNSFVEVPKNKLTQIYDCFEPFFAEIAHHPHISLMQQLLKYSHSKTKYAHSDVIAYFLCDKDSPIQTIEEAYFKLHCTSQRHLKPREMCSENIFSVLPNIAWTNKGPILPKNLQEERIKSLFDEPLVVSHVDKFPYLVDYHCPSGVRIVSGSQVRLGAYLGEGTTIMPAGFVNFNSCIEGNAMIEGRISSKVEIAKNTDVGGGASIMGVLSGGNEEPISIGEKCLLGANSGTGISLGFGCTVAAGTYVTAGSKISLYNQNNEPIDLFGKKVAEGKNIVKAKELSGKDHLLFYQDSVSGKLICKPNLKTIELNPELHGKQ